MRRKVCLLRHWTDTGKLSPSTVARYAAWMGGAVLSKVVFQQGHAIGKFDYDEVGPAVVHRKCC